MATLSATKAGITKAVHAGLNVVSVNYTVAASLSAGDTIVCCGIPKGAVVHDVAIAGGSGACTVDLGDSNDDDRYVAAESASVANPVVRSSTLGGLNYEYTADDNLIITVDAVATGTATGVFKLSVAYSLDQVTA